MDVPFEKGTFALKRERSLWKRTFALKATLSGFLQTAQICSYSRMLFKVTGIKRNWIIDNNAPILDCFNSYMESDRARNVQTYDFSTLYTNLRHDEIKVALKDVVNLAFKHSK